MEIEFFNHLLFFSGLFAAAHDLKIEWVIVKGISHFANGNNPAEKSWESYACIMAASLLSNMLKNSFVFEKWPHYEDLANKQEIPRFPDSLCIEGCRGQLKSLCETQSKVKIVRRDQICSVHSDKVYPQLSWLMEKKDPSGVTQKELEHYSDIFGGGRFLHTPKRILPYRLPAFGRTVSTQKATFDWSRHRIKGKVERFDPVFLGKSCDVCNLNDLPALVDLFQGKKILQGIQKNVFRSAVLFRSMECLQLQFNRVEEVILYFL